MQEYTYNEDRSQFNRHRRIEEELFEDHLAPGEAAFLHGYYGNVEEYYDEVEEN